MLRLILFVSSRLHSYQHLICLLLLSYLFYVARAQIDFRINHFSLGIIRRNEQAYGVESPDAEPTWHLTNGTLMTCHMRTMCTKCMVLRSVNKMASRFYKLFAYSYSYAIAHAFSFVQWLDVDPIMWLASLNFSSGSIMLYSKDWISIVDLNSYKCLNSISDCMVSWCNSNTLKRNQCWIPGSVWHPQQINVWNWHFRKVFINLNAIRNVLTSFKLCRQSTASKTERISQTTNFAY